MKSGVAENQERRNPQTCFWNFLHLDLRFNSASPSCSLTPRETFRPWGIAVGIAAVILLTSIGEGIHRFVGEFTRFGTNNITVVPGKDQDRRNAFRPALQRPPADPGRRRRPRTPAHVVAVTPQRPRQRRGRRQRPHRAPDLRRERQPDAGGLPGQLPQRPVPAPADDAGARAFVVLGAKLKNRLYGAKIPSASACASAVCTSASSASWRPRGQFLGIDLDDTAFIPAGRAQELFAKAWMKSTSAAEGVPSAIVAQAIKGA